MGYLMTFFTHFDAIQFGRYLKSLGISGVKRPVPREVSSSCGVCITFDLKEFPDQSIMQEGCNQLFRIENDDYLCMYDID